MTENNHDENAPLLSGRPDRNQIQGKDDDDDVELSGCGATICCDPRRALHRYLILIFICFLSFGSYFCYDNPSALQPQIKDVMHKDTADFMLLYSLYSWPNVVLCFFGGFLLDRVFGVRVGTLIFGAFVLVGQCIFALGATLNNYTVMLVGRFIFGLGGENLAVAQNTYSVEWFKGKELNMVFGLQLSFSRVGSTLNMNILGPIYKLLDPSLPGYTRLGYTLWIGAGMCVFSIMCAVFLGYFDIRASRILKRDSGKTGETIKLTDIKDFPLTLWLIFLVCVFYYVSIFPFIGLGIVFFEDKFDLSPTQANLVNSLVYFISAAASPFFGFIVDKTGRNIFWVALGICLTLVAHGALAFTFLTPFATMSLMGIAYSILACALWPIVAFIMPEHQLGTSYGFMQSIQNLGLAVVAVVAGKLVDSNGYLLYEVFNLSCLCISLICCVLMYFVDASKGGTLNMSTRERKAVAKKVEEDLKEKVQQSELPSTSSNIVPQSAFSLRNRYLSRLGAKLPVTYNPHSMALSRHGILQ
ncbi:major facilitator superfamily domain-containing protein 1 isoform X1 [Strongylocentrotus purpuratus]|uniref:Lysosomal dipeptide transporter MFSD1 n=1 Tax=Strongylocentrotus purpuratus TaxID=7668 RepID=A0A7M7NKA2_STRPU|nr:major facilitator superfamily domain-containing protein 1 isoform X1 [Strongylocentrotus purpuratus]